MGWKINDRFRVHYVLLEPYAKFISLHVNGQSQS
jgi:hypothetical protein